MKAIPGSPVGVSHGLHRLQHLCGYLKENSEFLSYGENWALLLNEIQTVTHQYIPFPAQGAAVALHLQICGWFLSPAEEKWSFYRTVSPTGFDTETGFQYSFLP